MSVRLHITGTSVHSSLIVVHHEVKRFIFVCLFDDFVYRMVIRLEKYKSRISPSVLVPLKYDLLTSV